MASPPFSASSPPYPAPLSLPRQRPSGRKLSIASQPSAHPLRQTSFPPSEAYERDDFSPAESLDSLDDADIRSAVGDDGGGVKKRKRGEKRPRGRPPKDPRPRGSVNGSESTKRAGAASVVTNEEDDDEDDEAGGASRAAGDFSLLPAEMDRDKQRKFLFREAIPPAHQARYDSFNTVKLRPADIRKLVNQTLSQSVPANVVTVVGSYTKMFAGMLIEAAREVQAERVAVMEKRADDGENAAFLRLREMEEPPEVEWETESEAENEGAEESKVNGETEAMEVDDAKQAAVDGLPDGDPDSADEKEGEATTNVAALPNGKDRANGHTSPKPKTKRPKLSHPDPLDPSLPEHDFSSVEPGAWGVGKFVEDCDRGPLQPDHLREALRRYKRRRDGGVVGFTGISLEGREGVAPRMGGKRLFR